MTNQATDTRLFVREFLRAPLRTASVIPSGQALADVMALPIAERGDPVVVELGPGTGAFTRVIQQRLAGRGRHMAVELNPVLATRLAAQCPGVQVVQAEAGRLPEILTEHGIGRADVIVSGLPWFAYTDSRSRPLVHTLAAALSTDGVLTQFAYSWTRWVPPARRLRRSLCAAFEEVVTSTTVWPNVPPAAVYFARRPRPVPSAA